MAATIAGSLKFAGMFEIRSGKWQSFHGKTSQIALSDIRAKLEYATFDFKFIIFACWLATLLAPWDLYRTGCPANAHPHPSLDSNQ